MSTVAVPLMSDELRLLDFALSREMAWTHKGSRAWRDLQALRAKVFDYHVAACKRELDSEEQQEAARALVGVSLRAAESEE